MSRLPVRVRWNRLIDETLEVALDFAWRRAGKHDDAWPNLSPVQAERLREQLQDEFWLAFYERFEEDEREVEE